MASDTSEITMDHLPANMTPQDQPREALTSLQESERQLIVRTLEATEYNKSETASRLDISRSTLYEKIKKYGITVHE
jgi:two-component system response regulator HydG